jgi:ABC-type transporter Mla maintaining outer membrane lipid asymmetry permease subunit MlaE
VSERLSGIFSTPLGKLLLGIIKIALAGFLISMISIFSGYAKDVEVGGVVLPVGSIINIILAIFPLLLLMSALRDLGIHL